MSRWRSIRLTPAFSTPAFSVALLLHHVVLHFWSPVRHRPGYNTSPQSVDLWRRWPASPVSEMRRKDVASRQLRQSNQLDTTDKSVITSRNKSLRSSHSRHTDTATTLSLGCLNPLKAEIQAGYTWPTAGLTYILNF